MQESSVTIFNVLGQTVYSKTIQPETSEVEINSSDFKSKILFDRL
jgi:hypothetical protein